MPGLPPVAPLICYEAIFPGEILADGAAGPGLILNVTNDAWFGQTPGPYQHFAQARLRAIEEGLPLVRAANTGISAVIDPYGRIVAQPAARDVEGVLDAQLAAFADSRRPLRVQATAGLVFARLCLIDLLNGRCVVTLAT